MKQGQHMAKFILLLFSSSVKWTVLRQLYMIPWKTKTFILVIPFSNHLFRLKNGFYGNEDLDLVILHSYMIPEYDLKHFYTISVHSYTILIYLFLLFLTQFSFLCFLIFTIFSHQNSSFILIRSQSQPNFHSYIPHVFYHPSHQK